MFPFIYQNLQRKRSLIYQWGWFCCSCLRHVPTPTFFEQSTPLGVCIHYLMIMGPILYPLHRGPPQTSSLTPNVAPTGLRSHLGGFLSNIGSAAACVCCCGTGWPKPAPNDDAIWKEQAWRSSGLHCISFIWVNNKYCKCLFLDQLDVSAFIYHSSSDEARIQVYHHIQYTKLIGSETKLYFTFFYVIASLILTLSTKKCWAYCLFWLVEMEPGRAFQSWVEDGRSDYWWLTKLDLGIVTAKFMVSDRLLQRIQVSYFVCLLDLVSQLQQIFHKIYTKLSLSNFQKYKLLTADLLKSAHSPGHFVLCSVPACYRPSTNKCSHDHQTTNWKWLPGCADKIGHQSSIETRWAAQRQPPRQVHYCWDSIQGCDCPWHSWGEDLDLVGTRPLIKHPCNKAKI